MKSVRVLILPLAFSLAFLFGFILRGSLPTTSVRTNVAFTSGTHEVSKVFDGDTIEVAGGTRIRYAAIDAPELHERYGTAAYELNQDLVSGKTVRVVVADEKEDLYGRVLGYVYVGDTFVNEKLVEEGYATALKYDAMKKPEFYEELLVTQEEARQDHRGMWVEEWK